MGLNSASQTRLQEKSSDGAQPHKRSFLDANLMNFTDIQIYRDTTHSNAQHTCVHLKRQTSR